MQDFGLLQIGGGVALGIAALRFAERGLNMVQDAYKKANGKSPSPHEGKTHDEAVLVELRSMNSNLRKHTDKLDRVHETTQWLKNREQWRSENNRGG